MNLTELADNYERLTAELRTIAEQMPGASAVRNQVGNLAVLDPAGGYIGWIDVLTGELVEDV